MEPLMQRARALLLARRDDAGWEIWATHRVGEWVGLQVTVWDSEQRARRTFRLAWHAAEGLSQEPDVARLRRVPGGALLWVLARFELPEVRGKACSLPSEKPEPVSALAARCARCQTGIEVHGKKDQRTEWEARIEECQGTTCPLHNAARMRAALEL